MIMKVNHPLCRSWGPKEAPGRKRAGSRALRPNALSCVMDALDGAEGILDWLATVLSFRQRWSSTLDDEKAPRPPGKARLESTGKFSYAVSSSLSCHSSAPRID